MYSEDMAGHAVIGEAAVNLAVREQEITIDTLMAELSIILKAENAESRRERISGAIAWLRDYRTKGSREVREKGWLLPERDQLNDGSDSTIRLPAGNEDKMR